MALFTFVHLFIEDMMLSVMLNVSASMEQLHQANEMIKVAAASQTSERLDQDLYILVAESAVQVGLFGLLKPACQTPMLVLSLKFLSVSSNAIQHGAADMANECLKMYFTKEPPGNQFLCRAYLCQAQLLAPTSAESLVSLKLRKDRIWQTGKLLMVA